MNKIFLLILVVLFVDSSYSFAQGASEPSKLSGDELVVYENQARQLVGFMEFALNTIGSNKTEYKDKHTIIDQSYLKFFKDDKVQIEDDLVEQRDMVTNKDVQAYLKDIDFFFKTVSLKYTVDEITQEVNESGEIFFKVKANRNLKGTTIEGKQINDNRIRYIELNLDEINRALKIVSIYTTKSNEEEELISWWNNLDSGWRNFLAGESLLNSKYPLREITYIQKDYVLHETVLSNFGDTLIMVDTIKIKLDVMLTEVRRILRVDQLSLVDVPAIYNLDPLGAFTLLKHLDISKATVPTLEPIRNLSKLETLIAKESLINSLEPIRYMPNIRILDVSGTLIQEIEPLEEFENIEVLDMSDSRIIDLSSVSKLSKLRELRINGLNLEGLDALKSLNGLEVLEISRVPINSIEIIKDFTKLKRLTIDQTNIENISSLSALHSLEYVFLDNTKINSLKALEQLSALKMIYCDRTLVEPSEAVSFMQQHPGVKVIYESQELQSWWQLMPDAWKEVFSSEVKLSEIPTREELHEVSFIKNIDVSGNESINTLEPLSKLSSLIDLKVQGTKVSDLAPLSNLFDLQTLNISNTQIARLDEIRSLTALQQLDISNTKVSYINSLVELPNLRTLKMDSTAISDIKLIVKLKQLDLLYAEGVDSLPEQLPLIWDSLPEILVIYQSEVLSGWWNGLSKEWKELFKTAESIGEVLPTTEQLHRISSSKKLDITKVKGITNLNPIAIIERLEELYMSNLSINDLASLAKINRLKIIDISDTPVSDLTPLAGHKRLMELNCSNSPIDNLTVIGGFKELTKLNISGTQVTKLNPLINCKELQELDCFNTRVSTLKPLDDLKNLRIARLYNTRLSDKKIEKFKELHPDTEVVYY